jgi:hypothetical protein
MITIQKSRRRLETLSPCYRHQYACSKWCGICRVLRTTSYFLICRQKKWHKRNLVFMKNTQAVSQFIHKAPQFYMAGERGFV